MSMVARTRRWVVPMLFAAPLVLGACSDMTEQYTIETQQDPQSGQNLLVYRTECAAVNDSSSFTVVLIVSGVLDGQASNLPTDQRFVTVAMETADGPPFAAADPDNDILKLGRSGERPVEVGGFGGGVRTDADGTVWNTWSGAAHPVHLGLLIGAPYVDGRYEDVEFTLADAKVRGLADFLRRVQAQ